MQNIYLINELGQGFSHEYKIYMMAMNYLDKNNRVIIMTHNEMGIRSFLLHNNIVLSDDKLSRLIIISMNHYIHDAKKNIALETCQSFSTVLYNSTKLSDAAFDYYGLMYKNTFSKYVPDLIITDRSLHAQIFCYQYQLLDKLRVMSSDIAELNLHNKDHFEIYTMTGDVKHKYHNVDNPYASQSEILLIQEIYNYTKVELNGLKELYPISQTYMVNFENPRVSDYSLYLKPNNLYHDIDEILSRHYQGQRKIVYLYLLAGLDKNIELILQYLSSLNVLVIANIKDKQLLNLIEHKNIIYLEGFQNQCEWIKRSDICIFSGVNSAYEAIYYNKPLLLNCRHWMSLSTYIELKDYTKGIEVIFSDSNRIELNIAFSRLMDIGKIQNRFVNANYREII